MKFGKGYAGETTRRVRISGKRIDVELTDEEIGDLIRTAYLREHPDAKPDKVIVESATVGCTDRGHSAGATLFIEEEILDA